MAEERGMVFGSYRAELEKIMNDFNTSTKGVFVAESRILVPSESPYEMDKRGIIVEHLGNVDQFEEHFELFKEELYTMAYKLDKRTSLYEYPFKSELCFREKWVLWGDKYVAYNFEL